MNRKTFKTDELAKTDPLIRLAIVEASISELNRKIELAQGQKTYWQDRENSWKKQISKKYEYQQILQNEVYSQ